MAELISVIVTTYNREDALDAVLRSLARQGDSSFEVIVADDGSGEATAKLVDAATICTPTVAHFEVGAFLLERGKQLVVEKTLADTPARAPSL